MNVDVYPSAVRSGELVKARTRSALPVGADAGSQLAAVPQVVVPPTKLFQVKSGVGDCAAADPASARPSGPRRRPAGRGGSFDGSRARLRGKQGDAQRRNPGQ